MIFAIWEEFGMTVDEKMNELVDLQFDLMAAIRNADSEIEKIELRERLDEVMAEIIALCDVKIEINE